LKSNVTDIAEKLDINSGSAYSRYHKICARLVPKQLTEEHKPGRAETRMQCLGRYGEEGEASLQWTVTGEGTWVYHYESASKRQSK